MRKRLRRNKETDEAVLVSELAARRQSIPKDRSQPEPNIRMPRSVAEIPGFTHPRQPSM